MSAAVADVRAAGSPAHFFNVNAADEERRADVAGEMERVLTARGEMGQLRILIHSLAFGTLKLFIAEPMKGRIRGAIAVSSAITVPASISGTGSAARATVVVNATGRGPLPALAFSDSAPRRADRDAIMMPFAPDPDARSNSK